MEKLLLLVLIGILIISGCSDIENAESNSENINEIENVITSSGENETIEVSTPKIDDQVELADENKIETSVFETAKEVKVTDARDLNSHITLRIQVENDYEPGLATLNVLTQTYDFLQQEDISGAETITIFIVNDERKFSEFKIDISKFKPNETESMANLVLAASEIEVLAPDVREFGEVMGLW